MILERVQTQTGYITKYIREHWWEWLKIDYARFNLSIGEAVPRFYLPVRRLVNRNAYECWFILLAPFALAWFIVSRMLLGAWRDLIDYAEYLREVNVLKAGDKTKKQ